MGLKIISFFSDLVTVGATVCCYFTSIARIYLTISAPSFVAIVALFLACFDHVSALRSTS